MNISRRYHGHFFLKSCPSQMFRVRNITHRALHSLIYSSLRNINILLYKSVDIHRVLLELTIWLTVISRYNSPQFSAV